MFAVPVADVPHDLPPGCRVVRVGRYGFIGAVWVDYEPTGVLSYRELMTTLLVRRGWRLLPTITHIWVDSDASRAGGRELWGIPKELATFDFAPGSFAAKDADGAIASGTSRARVRLPGRLPVRFSVVQWLSGRAKVSPVQSVARVASARVSFTVDGAGPLAFLAGRRPLMSFILQDFRMRFGG